MAYTYPDFATLINVRQEPGRRYSMEIEVDPGGSKTFVVIQKNPSRANAGVSDHTINRVLNYLYRNRACYDCLKGIQHVVFLNLIPWYETYSDRLAAKGALLEDPRNLDVIKAFLSAGNPCIIAWGNPPKGLRKLHEALSAEVLRLLGRYGNSRYHIGELTRLGYPRHGQIWGYTDPMHSLKKM